MDGVERSLESAVRHLKVKMAAVKSFKTDEALFSFFEGTGLYFGLSQPNYMPGSQIRHEEVYKKFFFNRPRNTIEHVGFELAIRERKLA